MQSLVHIVSRIFVIIARLFVFTYIYFLPRSFIVSLGVFKEYRGRDGGGWDDFTGSLFDAI